MSSEGHPHAPEQPGATRGWRRRRSLLPRLLLARTTGVKRRSCWALLLRILIVFFLMSRHQPR